MTIARGLRFDLRRALVVTVVALAGAAGGLVGILWLAGSSDAVDVKLGDPDFRGIDAADLASEIAARGPVPFPDLVGRDLPIWVTHAGGDPEVGWSTFSARVPGSNDCLVQWDPNGGGGTGVFYDSCDPKMTWAANGVGLDALVWTVITSDEGLELRIDVAGAAKGGSP